MTENQRLPLPDEGKRLNAPPPQGLPLIVLTSEQGGHTDAREARVDVSEAVDVEPRKHLIVAGRKSKVRQFIGDHAPGMAIALSITAFFGSIFPVLGLLFAVYSVIYAVNVRLKSGKKSKMAVWAIVVGALSTFAGLNLTISFFNFLAK